MSKKKAHLLLPKICEAQTNEQAIAVLYEILKELHLNSDYTDLIHLKDKLDEYRKDFEKLTDDYSNTHHTLDDMMELRTNLNFLYRDISELSFMINKNKIYFEEYKTVARAASIKELKNNPDFVEKFGIKSVSGIRDVVGEDGGYQEYVNLSSISYGLYQDNLNLLNSIRMWIDLMASGIKNEQLILQKDVK